MTKLQFWILAIGLWISCGFAMVWMIVGNDVVLVDTEDVPRIKQYRWHIEQGRVLRSTRNPKITTYLNRYIVNAQKDETVYFKSTNRFDLRKDNLLVIRKEESYE